MPLPEPSEQEGESVKAGQEPSPESPEPGTDVVPAAPTKPKEFSKLVLLTVSTENVDGVDSQPKGGHCVVSLEMSGPDALARTPQILPVEEQVGAVQPTPQEPEQKRSKPDTDGKEDGRLAGQSAPSTEVVGEEPTADAVMPNTLL